MSSTNQRKQVLIAESEANRGAIQREWHQATEAVYGELASLRTPARWIALAVSFWNRPAVPRGSSVHSNSNFAPGQGLAWLSRAIRFATDVIRGLGRAPAGDVRKQVRQRPESRHGV